METTEKIKRKQFYSILNALTTISEKGNLEFDEWLGLETHRLKLEEIKERETKLFKTIMEKTGYSEYAKKAEILVMKNTKKYTHTDEDIKVVNDFKDKSKEFEESDVEVPHYRISKSIISELPDEVLHVRKDLLPIIDTTDKAVGPKKSK